MSKSLAILPGKNKWLFWFNYIYRILFYNIDMAAKEMAIHWLSPSNSLASPHMFFVQIRWGADIVHNSFMNHWYPLIWATFMSGSSLHYVDTRHFF